MELICSHLMAVCTACILVTWVTCDDLAFRQKDYSGLREKAIIVLYLKEKAFYPHCYGVLVNWVKAVVPCECVSRGNDWGSVDSPWLHFDPPKAVCRLKPELFEAGMMQDMYNQGIRIFERRVRIKQIRLSDKCDGSYLFNYASLVLEKRPENSRLVWVYTASERHLRWQINKAVVSSGAMGMCVILKWVNDVKTLVRFNKYSPDIVTEMELPDNYTIKEFPVTFEHWFECVRNVCPRSPPSDAPFKVSRLEKYCSNEVNAVRYCATWENVEQRLCEVVPGTPVFCSRDGHIDGVVGLLYTRTTYCRETMNAVMTGFSNALELIQNDLRIRNAPGYKDIEAHWEKVFHDQKVSYSSSSRLVVNSVLTRIVMFSLLTVWDE